MIGVRGHLGQNININAYGKSIPPTMPLDEGYFSTI
jgi:hypothetical protein